MTQPDEKDAETTFGAQVRRMREARQWTQEQLRRQLLDVYDIDLSKTAMARLEQGGRPIRFNEVHALAALLGISLEFYGKPPAMPAAAAVDFAVQRVNEELAAAREEIARTSDSLAAVGVEQARLEGKMADLRGTMAMLGELRADLRDPVRSKKIGAAMLEQLGVQFDG